jgi:poly(hydroxyalkanoate) depolymerase family esterase
MSFLSTWLADMRRALASGNPLVMVWRISLAFFVLFWSVVFWLLLGWMKFLYALASGTLPDSRAQRDAEVTPSPLSAVSDFGSNPGDLRMWTYMPDGLPVGAPLIVVLHGSTQSARDYAVGAGWVQLAQRHGFALLCPEQTRANNGTLSFQWFRPEDIAREGGEAESVAQMVEHVLAAKQLDAKRVFVTGLSSGGAMTAVMLATRPDMFVAGAVIAGLPYQAAQSVMGALWAMKKPRAQSARAWGDAVRAAAPAVGRFPAISIWHGTKDRVVRPASAEALVAQWTNVHGIEGGAVVELARDGRSVQMWRSAEGKAAVSLHLIEGMGHGTPLASRGIDASGRAGPYLLDVGVNSSLEIIQAWGVAPMKTGELAPANQSAA